jgi:AMMECR1 domain-containing protein
MEELTGVRIEISALTPPRPLPPGGAIVIGRDGVALRLGAASAVFLPQVAPEQGWDAVTLLNQLARKAGLRPDRWREAQLQVFQAEVFGERRERSAQRPAVVEDGG